MPVRVIVTLEELDGVRVLRRGNTTIEHAPSLAWWLERHSVGTRVEIDCELDGMKLVAFDVVSEAKPLAPAPQVAFADPVAEEAEARNEAIRRANDARARRAGPRPDFDALEAAFDVRLPRHFRAAWLRWYEEDTVVRFIVAERSEIAQAIDFISEEHAEELHGRRILPFAEGPNDADYFVLDLSRPSNGDFPVLLAQHDVYDMDEVAASSEEWLARSAANWSVDET